MALPCISGKSCEWMAFATGRKSKDSGAPTQTRDSCASRSAPGRRAGSGHGGPWRWTITADRAPSWVYAATGDAARKPKATAAKAASTRVQKLLLIWNLLGRLAVASIVARP